MKKILVTLIVLLWPLTAFAWSGKVVGVTDGDTIKALHPDQGQVKIRFYGIDTPEKGQAYGRAATKYLASLIAGKTVNIESVTTDRYGRTVGIVTYAEQNINRAMIQAGYAWVYKRYCKRSFCDDWLMLEDSARRAKIGLWQESDPIPPWDWRRRK